MKNTKFLLFGLFFCLQSKADTFERVEIVGANKDGSKIAIIKSHFGPSSYAPFVEINVFQAQDQRPLLSKGYSSFQGDENAVNEMKEKLITENNQVLSDFGIVLQTAFPSIDAFVTDFDNQFLIEADLFKSGEISRYSAFFTESHGKCEGTMKRPMALQFCSLDEGKHATCSLIEPYTGPTSLSCYADKFKFSRAIKVNGYLWFFLFLRVEPLADLYYYPQFVHGEKLSN